MKMTVWDPFRLSSRMPGFEGFFEMPEWDSTELDMYEEPDKVVVKLKAPGFDEKNVDITVEDNSLTITGKAEKEEEQKDDQKKYYRKEISQRSFTRTISLPSRVIAEKAQAVFKNGILNLELPKAEESKPKKVNISVGK
jgi:HSP20 family protein